MVPVLHKALAAKPSLEMRKRIEGLLQRLDAALLTIEHVRVLRAVEMLERQGTPEARQLLQSLAEGAPGGLATTSAQAAMDRWQTSADRLRPKK